MKKNNFRIICKNNNAIMNLSDKNYYFFFAMEGNCKIKIVYPYYKWLLSIIIQSYHIFILPFFFDNLFYFFEGTTGTSSSSSY